MHLSSNGYVFVIGLMVFSFTLLGGYLFIGKTRDTRVASVTAWITRGLVSAAATVVALNIYNVVQAMRLNKELDSYGLSVVEPFVSELLFHGGLLVAAAAAVYFLGPPPESDE